MKNFQFYLFSFFLLYGSYIGAQTGGAVKSEPIKPHAFDRGQWKEATRGLDYSIEKHKLPKEPRQKKDPFGKADPETVRFWMSVIKWIILMAAISIIALMMYRFFGAGGVLGSSGQKIKYGFAATLAQIEENIHEADLRHHIQKAIAEEQYPLAIRLYYLSILKELSILGAISWKRDKTNRDYLAEMRGHDLSERFSIATLAFERIWYADIALTRAEFQRIEPIFQALEAAVEKESKKPVL